LGLLSRGIARALRRSGLSGRLVAPTPEPGGSGWRKSIDQALLTRLDGLLISSTALRGAGAGGERRGRGLIQSVDFRDYRAYQPGDDLRQVDWMAYARLGRPYVKLRESLERHPLELILDCSASMAYGDPPKLDFARGIAAGLAYVGLARYDVVRLTCLGETASSWSFEGSARFGELLERLNRVAPGGQLNPGAIVATLRKPRSAHSILISDLMDEQPAAGVLGALSRRGERPAVVHILSLLEMEPTLRGDHELIDLETGQRLLVGLSQHALVRYRDRLQEWLGSVERACETRGLRYCRLAAETPLARALLVDLQRAELLG
jgi:uncharacterized protein (DUF58 family)